MISAEPIPSITDDDYLEGKQHSGEELTGLQSALPKTKLAMKTFAWNPATKPSIPRTGRGLFEASHRDSPETPGLRHRKIVARRSSMWRAVLIGALITVTAGAQVPRRIVALSGQHAEGTTGSVNFSSFFPPVINAAGEVAFYAALNGADVTSNNSSGLWRSDAGALDLIARTGSTAPGTEAGVTFSSLTGLALNDLGDVGFRGFLLSSLGTTSNADYVGGETPSELLARTGSAAPGVGTGAVFSTVIAPLLNDQRRAAFFGLFTGPGVTSEVNDQALFLGGPGQLQIAARTGSPAPGTAQNFKSFDLVVELPALNDLGAVAFKAQTTSATGIWKGAPGALQLVALTGRPAPGTTTTYRSVEVPRLNGAGRAAFLGTTNGPLVNGTPVSAIWAETSGTPQLVAIEGTHAPGTPAAVNYGDLNAPAFSDAGTVAFGGALFGPGVVEFVNDRALWTGTPGNINLLARAGDLAPGTTDGSRFRSFSFPIINGAGQAAFVGSLNGANQNGIWATTLAGNLILIVRQGDQFSLGLGVTKTVQFATFAPGDFLVEGRAVSSPFNDAGQIAFRASFTDGSSGVFVASVPEPCTALLLMFGGLSLAVRRRLRAASGG
ncbi:MAG: choice-of-anchor tandem repeat NxxGxxAF-containing protein [Chthoniobacteraceae bacterium]